MMDPGPTWHGGRVHELCFRSEACRRDLGDAFLAALDRAESMELAALASEARALEESTAHGDPDLTRAAWDQVERFMAERPAQIQTWVGGSMGEVVDEDGDGLDGCTEDPDDGNL